MDLLKRSLAPITQEAWDEIDGQAINVLKGSLSARRVVDVKGPHGWDFHGWPMGRLSVSDSPFVQGTEHGIRKIQPLVEVRVPFSIDRWDLDDISRGSKTTDLSALEDAARKLALFEEKAVYTGMDSGCITGIAGAAEGESIPIPGDDEGLVQAIAQAAMVLKDRSVEGPYCLVCQKDLWKRIMTVSKGYPLKKRLEALAEQIVLSPMVDRSFLISTRGGDLELVLGQDISIGYSGTSQGKVDLFLTESFTFSVPGPEAIVTLDL
nr:family 1 encapsulin nanocompartment shell protein [uncultured Dethiosulfovibrio sp.]